MTITAEKKNPARVLLNVASEQEWEQDLNRTIINVDKLLSVRRICYWKQGKKHVENENKIAPSVGSYGSVEAGNRN